jgi:hypothetical protein
MSHQKSKSPLILADHKTMIRKDEEARGTTLLYVGFTTNASVAGAPKVGVAASHFFCAG